MSSLQNEIIRELNAKPAIRCESEISERVDFLVKYALKTGKKGFVLSISGGQDSTLAGKLTQIAVEKLRAETKQDYQFIALRLPYGVQKDEEDAQTALGYIQPDQVFTLNIKDAVDSSVNAFHSGTKENITDYLKGNIKARERMKVHYDFAGFYDVLVVGTDHASEAITGFFTKYGDGGCDVAPLSGLNKRQGRRLLEFLNAPKELCFKTPTADLLDNTPSRPDEDELNIKYDDIDDYLEGKSLQHDIQQRIENRYLLTEHKRRTPVTLCDQWWNLMND